MNMEEDTRRSVFKVNLLPHQKRFVMSDTPYTVLIGGRSCGKSYAAATAAVRHMFMGYDVCICAQRYDTLKDVLFKEIKRMLTTSGVNFRANNSKLRITMPHPDDSQKTVTCYCYSAGPSSVDAIRGLTGIKCLIIDEAALTSRIFFDNAIGILRGPGIGAPKIYLISTPRGGRNWLSQIIKEFGPGQMTVIHARSRDNTLLDESYFGLMERQYKGSYARQELEGEIVDGDADDQLVSTSQVMEAVQRIRSVPKDGPGILGVDIGRFGHDPSEGFLRFGRHIEKAFEMGRSDTFDLVEAIKRAAPKDKVQAIYLDGTGGFSSGPYDILFRAGYPVYEINFGKCDNPDHEHLLNWRAFIWDRLGQAITQGLALPENADLVEDILAQRYEIDMSGKRKLIDKTIIKNILGRSPDQGDAVALTFSGCRNSFDIFADCHGFVNRRTDDAMWRMVQNSYRWITPHDD